MGSITRFSGYAVNTGEFTSKELLEKIKGYQTVVNYLIKYNKIYSVSKFE